jgi:hypothetical protein
MADTITYWHIAHPTYAGGDLTCRDQLVQEGRAPEWAWGDDAPEGFDGDVVCLFPDTPDGRKHADWFRHDFPEHVRVRVEVPADTPDTTVTVVEEGYPAIIGHIPGEWCTIVSEIRP